MTSLAVLATACLLFPPGCTDSLTSAEMGRQATTLDVDPDSTTLAQDDSVQLEATPQDAEGNPVSGYEITWTSKNTEVATVEPGGVVVAHRSGSAKITASATNGDSEPLADRSIIAVEEGSSLITNVRPTEYVTATTAVGEKVYVDRDYTISEVPNSFQGWTYVRTADDDKSKEDNSAVTIALADTATVALAYDERANSLPHWLENWTDTGKVLGTTGVDYDIFTRVFGPGEVVLGGNQSSGAKGARNMYVLFSAPSNSLPDEDDELQTGDLQVSASTSGDPSDSDGYTVTVNDSVSKKMGPDESVRFSDLLAGDHQVDLSGIQSNCSVDGSNPRTVSVEGGNTASTSYNVSCTSTTGSLEVSASTTGDDPDSDGYTATVDGDASKEIGPNGSVTFSDLDAGEHEVELSGIQSNCSIDGSNPRTVSVDGDTTASTAFDVGCEAVPEPTIESATINSDGSQITLAFDQAVALGPNHEDAHLNPIDDTPTDNPTMSYASGEGTSSLVFDLSRTFLQGESPSIHYDQPGDGLQAGDSGADVPTFSEFAVTNNSTQGKTLEVSASTSGDDPDTDGYTVTVDGDASKEIGPDGTVTFSDLGVGDHQVELSGIKANCSVEGQNPRTVAVEIGNTATTSYVVNCASTAGALEVSAATSGDDPDSDGYTVTVDGDASKEVGPNDSVTFSGLDQGEHQVELTGVADNCSVEGSNPRTVSVEGGTTTSTDYAVSCTATTGALEVSTSTSGEDPDPDGYTVTVDGDASKEIGPNGSVTFSSLDAGEHEVELTGVANNCSVDGSNPRTVSVEAGNTASTSYNVSCTSTTGSLEVSASTTGDDPDSDGYTVTVDGDASKEIGPDGSVTFSDLSEGEHEIELSDVQSNCSVEGENPRTVDVEGGSTASTAFDVGCEAVSEPTIESATINEAGSQITLAFDQAVSLGPNHDDAHLNPIDDTPHDNPTMSFASGEGSSSLVFDLSRTFLEGESPSIHYDQPGDGLQASDTGADLPTFSEFDVTNNSTQGGTLEVSTSTSGDDPDSDGYTVTVDGSNGQDIDPNGSTTFTDLDVGEHEVELTDVAGNCSIDGSNPRTVSVEPGNNATASFEVSCSAATGTLEVSASTSGDDQDTDGYTVTIDGNASKEIDPNGMVTFADLDEGDHQVGLSDIQSNCSVDGQNPRTVSVTAGNTTTTSFSVNCEGTFGDRNAVLWEYEEWSLQNSSYSGNPFDVIATVTFEHQGSSKSHTTEMFYDGDDTWKFRFTGTRTGTWTFTTSSDDPELDGHSGTVDVADNTSSQTGGFLKTQGNKFGRQVDGVGTLDPVVWTVYNDAGNTTFTGGADYRKMSNWTESNIRSFASRAKTLGMNHIFLTLYNQVFVEDAFSYNDHNKSNPGLSEFQTIENVIGWARDEGVNVHFWMWGDESTRGWTPVGLEGGINGTVDQRLQRYIAARLGPIPGWTMGYGFDLYEWVSNSELEVWASNMHDHAGWPHMLMARKKDVNLTNTDVKSEGKLGPDTFSEAISKLEPDKPYVEEERFYYNRTFGFGGESQTYDMDFTMELIWRLGMAEGSGAIWGSSKAGNQYPNPEWLKTFGTFFENYLRFDMSATETLSDGIGMKSADNEHYVFFKQGTSSIQVDLSGMNGSQPLVAIDTRAPYQEVDLGTLDPTNQTIDLPHSSDWAIAVGNF